MPLPVRCWARAPTTSKVTNSRARATSAPAKCRSSSASSSRAMPHGDTEEFAFDNFRQQAMDNGGVISDEMLESFREEVARGLQQSRDNIGMMQEEDYI